MYESPINIIYGQMQTQIEGDIFQAIQTYGINVNKEELILALKYDRNQYERGRQDGRPKWIPVTERLPEKGGSYLVFSSKSKTVFTAHYWLGDRWANRANGQFITHWMPLPEPPDDA